MDIMGRWICSIGSHDSNNLGIAEVWTSQPITLMVTIALLIGVIVSFLLLRPRLRKIKPLWTCAMLSIVAHLLLICYFYGTTLIVALPAPQEVVRFQLIDYTQEFELKTEVPNNDETTHPRPQPWEQPTLADLVEPESNLREMDVPVGASVPNLELPPPSHPQFDTTVHSDIANSFQQFNPSQASELRETTETFLAQLTRESPDQVIDRENESRVEPQAIERTPPDPGVANANLIGDEQTSQNLEADVDDELDAWLANNSQPKPLVQDGPMELQPIEPKPLETNLTEIARQFIPETPTERESHPGLTRQVQQPPPEELQPHNWRSLPARQTTNPTTDQRLAITPAKVVRAGDGRELPEIFQARAEHKSERWLELAGGSEQTEQAVRLALDFLTRAQEQDGRWDASRFGGGMEYKVLGHDRGGAGLHADTAVTALALLAMLAAGNTHLEGEFQDSTRRGLEYLISVQTVDGNLAGAALLFSQMYCHSMATLALSEAYAMTGDERLRNVVQRAVNYSVRAQHPQNGGWRYRAGDLGDMSQFGWHVMALKSAQLGGIEIPESTWRGMRVFLESCCSGAHRGLAAYQPGQGPSRVMTAEALVCRFFLETEPNAELVREAAHAILASKPGDGLINFYYWYYATYALNMAGGNFWNEWNQAMKTQLLAMQRQDGALRGSFDPNGVWCGYGGRIYSTAMATLCLESYYRYLPAFSSNIASGK